MRIYHKYLLHLYWIKFANGLVTDYSYASYFNVSKLINELKVLLTSRFWRALSDENRLFIGRVLCCKHKFAQYARILDDNSYNAECLESCDSCDDVDDDTPNFSDIFDSYDYASNLIRSCDNKTLKSKASRRLINKQIAYCDAEINMVYNKIIAIISETLHEQTTTISSSYYSSNKTAATYTVDHSKISVNYYY